MSNFGVMVQRCKDAAQEPGEATSIKEEIASALVHYRGERFDFCEKIGTFNTVAAQELYTPGADAVPGDIMAIDYMRRLNGTVWQNVELVTIGKLLSMQNSSTFTGWPRFFAWYSGKVVLFPIPNAVFTMKIHYLLDASRDTASGNPITVASGDTVTNDFFTAGEELLRTRALYTFALGRGTDDSLATRMKLLNREAWMALQMKAAVRRLPGQVAANI